PPSPRLHPYTPVFRSPPCSPQTDHPPNTQPQQSQPHTPRDPLHAPNPTPVVPDPQQHAPKHGNDPAQTGQVCPCRPCDAPNPTRSEEHTSELQSRENL